jgi:C4-dicarboxylate-specific signal transduction histidine kinase
VKKNEFNKSQNFILYHIRSIFFLSLILSFLISVFLYQKFDHEEVEYRQLLRQKYLKDFDLAFEQYLHPLQGIVSSMHLAQFKFSARDFRNSAESRDLYKNFEGSLGFGFIRRVSENQLGKYLQLHKKDRPNFGLRRFSEKKQTEINSKQDLFFIEYIEPVEINQKAVGLVISDEENRKNAAMMSMKTGRPTLTLSIQLVQADKAEPGFLYYLPVYKTPRTPDTEEERIRKHIGWAYAPLLASKIVHFLNSQNPNLTLTKLQQINEQGKVEVAYTTSVLSLDPHDVFADTIEVAGQKWVVSTVMKQTDNWSAYQKSSIILLVLFLFSFSFFYYSKSIIHKIKFNHDLLVQTQQKVKSATKEIENQKQFLQKIIDNIPAPVGYWDTELKSKLANKKYFDFYSLKTSEMNKESLKEVLGSEYNKSLPYIQGVLAGVSQKFERKIQNSEGLRTTMVNYIPDIVNDKVAGFCVLIFDITDMRALQENEKKQEELLHAKSKLSLMGEMSSGIAHEINNPLTIIKGKASVLSRLIENSSMDAEQLKLFKKNILSIDQTVDRIARIIKGMRSFSREAEEDPYQTVTLHNIIDELNELVSERIKSMNIKLEFVGEINNKSVYCNKTQIQQVLLNLVSNSMFAISQLDEKWIQINMAGDENQIKFQVTDSGTGIGSEIVEKIMNPFFTTKMEGHGTGLGLSISKGIVEKHNGELYYELNQGHTSFIVLLPVSNTNVSRMAA